MNETGNNAHISADAVPTGPRVYFIREGDAIKIGFSEKVERRLAGLQSGHHGALELVGTIPATVDLEQTILTRFQHLRIRGEWFRAEPELLEFIKNPDTPPPPPPSAQSVSDAFARYHKKKFKEQSFGSIAESYASTEVGYWLKMLINGETPQRIAGLNAAVARLESAKLAMCSHAMTENS